MTTSSKILTALVQDIFTYLEVDNTFTPNVSSRVNRSGIPRSKWLQDFLQPTDNKTEGLLKTADSN